MERGITEWRVQGGSTDLDLPASFRGAPWPGDDLLPEIGLLLPTYTDELSAPAPMVEAVAAFLADPNLVPEQLARTIRDRGGRWIVNLPSVAQHEEEFRRLLSEVDLDYPREILMLARLSAAGLATMATVCGVADVKIAEAARPHALFVLPPVPDYADGVPSLDRRRALEAQIAAATDLPVLGLRAPGEPTGDRPATLLRPVRISR